MAAHKGIRLGFAWPREPSHTTELPQMPEAFLPSGQQLMHIGLMPYIKDNSIPIGVEHFMQGYR
jgi:hypothetical protein